MYVFTEMWLNDRDPDAATQLDGLALHQADRDPTLCGKTRGGGVFVYINTDWCNNSVLVFKSCSSLVEYAVVRCRPFYLPRELSSLHIVAVYIPPCANAKKALAALYRAISDHENKHPEGLIIVARDFNHANLKAVLPKFHLHVDFARRGPNMLDLVYSTIPRHTKQSPNPTLDTQTTFPFS